MKIKPELQTEYDQYVKTNSDHPYSKGVVDFTERWATLMEAELAKGYTVPNFASQTSHQADTDGITGFMYGCAVSALARFWEHGEELRQWHNLATELGDEGKKANEKGTVLNPALLKIG